MKLFAVSILVCLECPLFTMADDSAVSVRSDDPEMRHAIEEARSSIKVFLDALMSPTPTQGSFLVKIAFVNGEEVEHIWLADLRFGEKPTGVIASRPLRKDLRFKQRVPTDFRYLSDWMFIDDGKLVGGFTTRLLRKRMTPEEREKSDKESPFRIE